VRVERLLIVALLIAALGHVGYTYVWQYPRGSVRGPPVSITDEPIQVTRAAPLEVLVSRDGRIFQILGTHDYEVSGRVLSATTYNVISKNAFFDVDLGLAWGPRVERMLANYQFRQNDRWLFWQSKGPVSDEERAYITAHIGNEHLIPKEGSATIARAIRWARAGDDVRIKGKLVTVRAYSSKEVVAQSSLSRDDVGAGACEIVYVEEFQLNEKLYR